MSIKILLADDSITIQKVVGIIFGGEDYSLTVVDNGKAAVEKARELNPDVLLIDALMPGMSGYEVCEAIRATPALASKPILLLTGSFEPFDETKAKNCGADDFLAKPFESQQIITKVKELFDMAALRSGSSPSTAEPEAVAPPSFADFDVETAAVAVTEEPASNDIWGAFTAPDATAASTEVPDEDETFFAIDDEQPEAFAAPEEPIASNIIESSGSQWIPVEEETFEFEEEASNEPLAPAISETEMFAESNAFEMEIPALDLPAVEAPAVPEPIVPVFSEPEEPAISEITPPPVPQASTPLVTPAAAVAAPAAMTEDQLRVALAGASREIIERIVWEVVPDLAEIMIKEAIRKIKEGM
jgi:CheY-like chemotaxis protein